MAGMFSSIAVRARSMPIPSPFRTTPMSATINSVPFTSDSTDPEVQAWVTRYQEKYNELPSQNAARAYDATMILLNAIKTAGSTIPRRFRMQSATRRITRACRVASPLTRPPRVYGRRDDRSCPRGRLLGILRFSLHGNKVKVLQDNGRGEGDSFPSLLSLIVAYGLSHAK